MSKSSLALQHIIRTTAGAYKDDQRSDDELLSRYAVARDETAFATLMVRHGPMVWGICTRILGNTEDVDDAYQVVMLTLAKNAGKIQIKTMAGWLHEVACRTALNTRKEKRTRKRLQETIKRMRASAPAENVTSDETQELLHEEIARLPLKLRTALVLHYLESKTQSEVARILGVRGPAVCKRLARALAILQRRLTKRGLTLGAAGLGAMLAAARSPAALPPDLVATTVQSAAAFRDGKLTGGLAELADDACKYVPAAAPWWKASWPICLLCVSGLWLGGVEVAWKVGLFDGKSEKTLAATNAPGPQPTKSDKAAAARKDLYGDPLPPGALVRLGTIRLRTLQRPFITGAFIRDGKFLALSDDKREIVFLQTASGRETRRLNAEFENLSNQAWGISSDGNKLATTQLIRRDIGGKVELQRVVQLWDISSPSPIKTWERRDNIHSDSVRSVQFVSLRFSPTDKLLAVAASEKDDGTGAVRLFDAATGEARGRIDSIDCRRADSVNLSGDGAILSTPWGLWNTTTGRKLVLTRTNKEGARRAVTVHPNPIAVSQDGKLAAVLTRTADDAENRRPKVLPLFGPGGADRNAQRQAESGSPSVLSLFSTLTGSEIHVLTTLDWNLGHHLIFDPDGRRLIVADGHGRFHFWNTTTGKPAAPSISAESSQPNSEAFGGGNECFSRDGRFYLACGRPTFIWNVETGRFAGGVPIQGSMHGTVSDIVFSPSAKSVATKSEVDGALLWDAETGRLCKRLGGSGDAWIKSPLDYSSEASITAWIHSDGNSKLQLKRDERLIRWNLHTRDSSPQRPVAEAGDLRAFSDNGQRQVWASEDSVRIMDRSMKKEVNRFPGLAGWDAFATISADGETVLIEEKGHNLNTYSINTGRRFLTLNEGTEGISACRIWGGRLSSVALSGDGRWLAAYQAYRRGRQGAYREPAVRLWEVASGRELANFRFPQEKGLRCLLWSSDARLLAGGDEQGTVWLWDFLTSRQIASFSGHRGAVTSLAFNSDRSRLASASEDVTALIWDISGLPVKTPNKLTRSSEDYLWNTLRETHDGELVFQVMEELTQRSEAAVRFLRQRLIRGPAPDPESVAALLAHLDDSNFTVRRRAFEHLSRMDERLIPALRQALADKPSVDKGRMIEELMQKIGEGEKGTAAFTPKQLQACRALAILERIGSRQAKRLLEELADSGNTFQATEARSCLHRLAKQPSRLIRK